MRVKLQLLATVVCVFGILFGFACKLWFPQYWFDLYPLILVVYWVIEMAMSFLVGRFEGHMADASLEGGKWMKIYMLSKFVKVIVTLALIFTALNYIPDDNMKLEFAGCAVAFYFLNLGIETFVITRKK